MKITPKRYLQGFGIIVLLLALVRCIFPSIAKPHDYETSTSLAKQTTFYSNTTYESGDEVTGRECAEAEKPLKAQRISASSSPFIDEEGQLIKHPIRSVPNYANAFPDLNDMQLLSAEKYGVQPVSDRKEAENRKGQLVYVGSNPYFYIDKLNSSIPYLVPRASVLLQDIGRNFFDSLQIKGVPLHKIIITSVLRTREDVKKLRTHNGNASENSCHQYGTTFDISYNRYKTVEVPDASSCRKVRNDTLKWILSEVLNDMRRQNRCYIKYEVKQGCFHSTVK